MPITEIKTVRRPNTSVPFFNESGNPQHEAVMAQVQPFKDSGVYTFTRELSNDGLVQTNTNTFADINVYSQVDSFFNIALDNAYLNYAQEHSFTTLDYTQLENRRNTYVQTGINQTFKVTTTYTFPPIAVEDYSPDQLLAVFANSLESFPDGLSRRTDLILDDNVITIIHQYSNSQDYTDNCYNDLFYVPQLAEKGVTRTIKFELV